MSFESGGSETPAVFKRKKQEKYLFILNTIICRHFHIIAFLI